MVFLYEQLQNITCTFAAHEHEVMFYYSYMIIFNDVKDGILYTGILETTTLLAMVEENRP